MAKAELPLTETEERLRIDKWLWAARFFKTRSLAAKAVGEGKVRVNDERVKPAKELRRGDQVAVRIGDLEWIVDVLAISDRRGSAEQAHTLYAEIQASREKRMAALAERQARAQLGPERRGRPTKRDRRLIHRFTQR